MQRYAKEFYSSDVIHKAINDYRAIASISVSEEVRYYVCDFSNCVIDPNTVILEFNNYLIELMHTRGASAEA